MRHLISIFLGGNIDHSRGNIELLPDSQNRDEIYSLPDVQEVRDYLTKDALQCTIIEVRAGILVKDLSLKNLQSLLRNYPENLKLMISSEPYDNVSPENVASAIKILGDQYLLLNIPEVLLKKVNQVLSGVIPPNHIEDLNPDPPSSNVSKLSFELPLALAMLLLSKALK